MNLKEKTLVALTYLQAYSDGDTDTVLAVTNTVSQEQLTEGLAEAARVITLSLSQQMFPGKEPDVGVVLTALREIYFNE